MPVELVVRLAISVVVRRFRGMSAADSRLLSSESYVRACNISSVDRLPFPFDGFWGMRGDNSSNVFLLLFMVLWVPIFAMLSKRAVPMLWHVSLFLGLRPVAFPPLFLFLIGGFYFLLLVRKTIFMGRAYIWRNYLSDVPLIKINLFVYSVGCLARSALMQHQYQ
jgi:hypothetical protein